MLRKLRIAAAVVCFALVTLLFLDFTGTLHAWFGWLARIQFLPALLAVNVGVVAALVVATLLFGRVYCSVVCPLGVMQDGISHLAGRRTKNRFRYSPAKTALRYTVLALFIAALAAGIGSLVALLAPYSAYGRIAQNLLAPLWGWGNNLLAYFAERIDSYAFYRTDVWVRSAATFAVAAATFALIAVLAWRNGRTWCNTVCPVGTVLGFLARFSLLRPVREFANVDADDAVLLQGVVDCFSEEGGELVVVDFKTDRVSRDNLEERAAHYRPQLEAYSMALARVTGKRVKEKLLYFFSAGEEVRL